MHFIRNNCNDLSVKLNDHLGLLKKLEVLWYIGIRR